MSIRESGNKKNLGIVNLSQDDRLRLVSDWNLCAVFALLDKDNFVFNVSNIAASLSLSHGEACRCLETLEMLKLIEKQSDGSYLGAEALYFDESDLDRDQTFSSFRNILLNIEARFTKYDICYFSFEVMSPDIVQKYYSDIFEVIRKISIESRGREDSEVYVFLNSIVRAGSKSNNDNLLMSASAQKFAHDIRSPLSALNAVASRFHEMPIEIREVLESATARINSIATEVLEKKRKTERSSVDRLLSDKVDLILQLQNLVKEKTAIFPEFKIQLKLDLGEVHILKESVSVVRVISNLLNNAIEASEPHSSIFLSAHRSLEKVIISVVDMGCGMSDSTLSQIRLTSYTTKGGNGIGVRSAYEFANLHNGDVKIRSQLGIGTQGALIFVDKI